MTNDLPPFQVSDAVSTLWDSAALTLLSEELRNVLEGARRPGHKVPRALYRAAARVAPVRVHAYRKGELVYATTSPKRAVLFALLDVASLIHREFGAASVDVFDVEWGPRTFRGKLGPPPTTLTPAHLLAGLGCVGFGDWETLDLETPMDHVHAELRGDEASHRRAFLTRTTGTAAPLLISPVSHVRVASSGSPRGWNALRGTPWIEPSELDAGAMTRIVNEANAGCRASREHESESDLVAELRTWGPSGPVERRRTPLLALLELARRASHTKVSSSVIAAATALRHTVASHGRDDLLSSAIAAVCAGLCAARSDGAAREHRELVDALAAAQRSTTQSLDRIGGFVEDARAAVVDDDLMVAALALAAAGSGPPRAREPEARDDVTQAMVAGCTRFLAGQVLAVSSLHGEGAGTLRPGCRAACDVLGPIADDPAGVTLASIREDASALTLRHHVFATSYDKRGCAQHARASTVLPPPAAGRDPGLAHFGLIASNVDTAPLLAELERNAAYWTVDTSRQKRSREQKDTETIFLRAGVGEAGLTPEDMHGIRYTAATAPFEVIHGWLLAFCESIDSELGRATIVRLQPGKSVLPHIDRGEYYVVRNRYHLVLKSALGSPMKSGGESCTLQEGELWWFDNEALHEAHNVGDEWRIHVIFDARPRSIPFPFDANVAYPERDGAKMPKPALAKS